MRDDDGSDRAAGDAASGHASEEELARARADAEERAWREIVDHYGERADVDGLSDLTTPLEQPVVRPVEYRIVSNDYDRAADEAFRDDPDDEGFVPPPLPPPAVISPERRVAWVGLVVSPCLLILFQLTDFAIPGIVSAGLVIAFVASFGYLVATMTPRDPDDDGARV